MSDQTQYTMYRKDARGTITVDLNDPVFSLDQLIEKQRVIIEDREQKIAGWQSNIAHHEELLAMDEKTMHRLETARDAARKAVGPSERGETDGE
jgi:uncharacterized protein (DUF3084 family)